MKRFKIFTTVLVVLVFALSLGVFVGCSPNGATNNLTTLEHSTISALGIFKANASSGAGLVSQSVETLRVTTDESQDTIINNLAVAYSTSNKGVERSAVTASDREGFDYKYTVTLTERDGSKTQYVFHYNTVAENKRGTESFGSGIVVVDGVEYSVVSEREVEHDEEEITFIIRKDADTYVVVEQETEQGENSLSYTAYVNGRKVYETETEYEEDRTGKIKIEYSVEVNGVETEYTYSFITENGVNYAKVVIETESGRDESRISYKFRIDTDLDGAVTFVPIP